ncbi:AGC protein kinase Gad8 [Tulasnella sp. 424]|nr:AGC protein kinase Gad8 [Tulasnella sp. 424]KAG8980349.1 AGC protein kinase Gad8 [Tulasnella sp. 425]
MPDAPISRTGLLTIRVAGARGLSLPSGVNVPPVIQQALSTQQAQVASSVTSQSVSQQHRLAQKSGKRESLQRKQCWWLPYIVLEFDKNEILIDSLGGTIQEPVWMFQAHFDVSRVSEIALQFYLRNGTKTEDLGNDELGKADLFMGNLTFVPDFDRPGTVDQWYDVTNGGGQVNVAVTFRASTNQSLSIDSFDLLKVIGKGSFGKVMQVRKRDTSRIYALKTIRKAHIASRNEITHTLAERTVLAKVNNPFIVPLKFSFQSPAKLYLVLAFVNGGELFHHLQREQRFNEERSRFYAAELLLALEHLHAFNVVYRDLKPENILLDYTGHIALCDFGLCKLNMSDQDTTNTFCGTPEYLAPELLLGHGYSKTVDWWTLGVLLYEMLTGLPPYYDENTNEMYRKILQDPLRFGDEVGSDARSLLTALLTRDPSQRLGVNGAEEIKRHPFFSKHINFERLLAKKIQPPFKPSVASAIDTSNFDQVFTSEEPLDSVVPDSDLSKTVQDQFAGFSYDGRADELDKGGQSYIG